MNETAKKYLELMKKNGEDHLEGLQGFIDQTTEQLKEAEAKKEEILADLEELEKAFEAEWSGSLIAQLVEHLAVNQRVLGSSPSQGAIMYSYIFRNRERLGKIYGTVAQSAEAIDLKSIKWGFESPLSYQYSLN